MSWISCLRLRNGKPRKKRKTPARIPANPQSSGDRSIEGESEENAEAGKPIAATAILPMISIRGRLGLRRLCVGYCAGLAGGPGSPGGGGIVMSTLVTVPSDDSDLSNSDECPTTSTAN